MLLSDRRDGEQSMMLYHKFRNSSLDTSPVGLISGPEKSDSVYTPAGSRILAWGEAEGVHFCQVEGFGGAVFAVNPSAPPGDCVHPVASSLLDFIGLICQCRNAGLIAQAYQWSRARFEEQIAAVSPTVKMSSVLRALKNTYHPAEITDPYGYIAKVQGEFDYSSLPLHPDYYEWCPIRPGTPKWDVGFGISFADYCEKGRAGQELAVNRSFLWNNENWFVPAVYLCDSGIVIDSCLEVSGEAVESFMEKWGNRPTESLSIEEEMRRKLDNPLEMDAKGSLTVNNNTLPLKKLYTLCWNPRAENNWKARRVLEHYGLDREKGYLLRRECFLRKGKQPPIRNMALTLQAEPVSVPGQRFTAPKSGEYMTFTHPATGKLHRLRVIAQTREALDPNFLSNHPCCYTRLTFSLEPQISRDLFSVVDCDPGDPWQGNADDPAAMFFTGKTPSAGHFALSSLRYTPAEQITWRMIFRQKLRQDVTIPLLP